MISSEENDEHGTSSAQSPSNRPNQLQASKPPKIVNLTPHLPEEEEILRGGIAEEICDIDLQEDETIVESLLFDHNELIQESTESVKSTPQSTSSKTLKSSFVKKKIKDSPKTLKNSKLNIRSVEVPSAKAKLLSILQRTKPKTVIKRMLPEKMKAKKSVESLTSPVVEVKEEPSIEIVDIPLKISNVQSLKGNSGRILDLREEPVVILDSSNEEEAAAVEVEKRSPNGIVRPSFNAFQAAKTQKIFHKNLETKTTENTLNIAQQFKISNITSGIPGLSPPLTVEHMHECLIEPTTTSETETTKARTEDLLEEVVNPHQFTIKEEDSNELRLLVVQVCDFCHCTYDSNEVHLCQEGILRVQEENLTVCKFCQTYYDATKQFHRCRKIHAVKQKKKIYSCKVENFEFT